MEIIQNFHQLLVDVYEKSKINFSGLGLLVYNDLSGLPISPLKHIDERIGLPITDYNEVIEKLVTISISQNKYHDGFHLLNERLELTHLSQYIAPPIFENIEISDEYGSRYRTALYASAIPNIICSGVLSTNYPVTIFKQGLKLDFK